MIASPGLAPNGSDLPIQVAVPANQRADFAATGIACDPAMIRAPLSPACALVAHIEHLVVERRVLVIGNAERSLAEHLVDRGARLVQVLDPEPKRVSSAAANNGERRVTFAQYSDASLRDGSFDLAIIEDVNLVGDLPRLVSNVRRSMNSRGVAIFCATNPNASEGLLGIKPGRVDYEELCDATETEFEAVITLGQSPFLGYSVVQFDLDHPPEPALDNAFLNERADPPDLYIALCGTDEAIESLDLEEMSIVQLPAARFVENSERIHRERELRAARHVANLEKELRALKERGPDGEVERLMKELDQRNAWIKQLESRAESADARADDAEGEVEELEKEIETSHQKLLAESQARARDEKELATLRKQLEQARLAAKESEHQSAGRKGLEEELTALDKQRKDLEVRLEEKGRALERLEKRLAEQEREIDDLHDHLDETDEALAQARAQLAASSGPTSEEIDRDLRSLEEQLKNRGKRVAELEEQLKKLEIYAKTLAAEVQTKPNTDSTQVDPGEFERLSRALAEREADLVAAQWTIGQLKQTSLKE